MSTEASSNSSSGVRPASASGLPEASRMGFIGAGQMALAMAKGFMAAGMVAPSQVFVSAPSDTNLLLWRQLGATTTHSNSDVILACDIIFLAVKPNVFPKLIAALQVDGMEDDLATSSSGRMSPSTRLISVDSKLFVSVMAGVTLKTLARSLANVVLTPRIVRAHPNTPAKVGCGCAVYSLGEGATSQDGELIKQLFSSIGICEQVDEYQQDAFTGLAGSGPAYVYTLLEALSDGGVRMGLPRTLATKFAAQTMLGAAKMVLETGKHPGQLKDEVTSPGGTTIRGIQVLERGAVRGVIMDAVQAAAERAAELGQS